jgi:hypothetical protein
MQLFKNETIPFETVRRFSLDNPYNLTYGLKCTSTVPVTALQNNK